PPALQALLEDESLAIDGFLAPGHVSVILGSDAYRPVAQQYRRPCVITGFDGVQMLMGMVRILTQLVADRPAVENIYLSRITPEGNVQAKELISKMFRPVSSMWRGLGTIDASGLELRESYGQFDARVRFSLPDPIDVVPPGCQCGQVIKGILQPHECALFSKACTPARPVGACMVSREGACRAYYRYRRVQT
ncbi:MAG: hydrogenase formation protein HypD, partial [Sedimentisphaerales bacterium]|nr:hydrogenase formation protein HypD [Sedimentisphaerales bacterium]